jgi:uncharacterized membrane protein
MGRRRPTKPIPSATSGDPAAVLLAAVAGVGWSWAFGLLAARACDMVNYLVVGSAPPLWGWLVRPVWQLLLATGLGGGLVVGCVDAARRSGRRCPPATVWLAAAWAMPLLDLLRLASVSVPQTVWEPLFFALVTGAVVGEIARQAVSRRPVAAGGSSRRWLWAVWLMSAVACGWWYCEGLRAYHDYLLGFHDFGHFAYRVASTWEGRGFLRETPSLPAFWDHFNPGLALVAPLWGLWPDARLFLLLQAMCLAAPAPVVFGIAREWGASAVGAAIWAAAYLAYPAVGLMNLNYTYGWHPVSLALPLLFLAIWALLRGRLIAAAASLLVVCSFEETLFVVPACLAAVAGVMRVVWRPQVGDQASHPPSAFHRGFAGRLPAGVWLTVWAVLTAAFVVIYREAAFAGFQTSRFAALGNSPWEIILSPLQRPRAFWGRLCREQSLLFLAALIVPFGWRNVTRGWPFLLALALPLGVLLVWHHGPATSIAFQYVTSFIPVLLLAAICGAVSDPRGGAVGDPTPDAAPAPRLLVAGLSALASCLTAAFFFGVLPGTRSSLVVLEALTYPIAMNADHRPARLRQGENPRAEGTIDNVVLDEVVARVNRPDASVLATGHIAAHLLNAARLEPVDQAVSRWEAFRNEVGPGRKPVELFDWIVLDTWEQFQQSRKSIDFVMREAHDAGYKTVKSEYGLVVLRRPESR